MQTVVTVSRSVTILGFFMMISATILMSLTPMWKVLMTLISCKQKCFT
jgi:hypothetical protein